MAKTKLKTDTKAEKSRRQKNQRILESEQS